MNARVVGISLMCAALASCTRDAEVRVIDCVDNQLLPDSHVDVMQGTMTEMERGAFQLAGLPKAPVMLRASRDGFASGETTLEPEAVTARITLCPATSPPGVLVRYLGAGTFAEVAATGAHVSGGAGHGGGLDLNKAWYEVVDATPSIPQDIASAKAARLESGERLWLVGDPASSSVSGRGRARWLRAQVIRIDGPITTRQIYGPPLTREIQHGWYIGRKVEAIVGGFRSYVRIWHHEDSGKEGPIHPLEFGNSVVIGGVTLNSVALPDGLWALVDMRAAGSGAPNVFLVAVGERGAVRLGG